LLARKRTYGLGIWGLGLGYYLFYTPYSGLTKALSKGLLTGAPVSGAVLLPASVMATVVCMLGFITAMNWWTYAGRREFFGVSIPFPRRETFLSAICMATIIGTTTLAFSFGGISIVLVLVLLRGGVLILAPLVDTIRQRRVRWFSWAAMWVSLIAVLVVLSDAGNFKLSFVAMLDIGAYLTAYFFKFQFMTKLAKSNEQTTTLRYFVEEQMIASPLLLLALGVMALIGSGEAMLGFRVGFTAFLGSAAVGWALLVGLFYAALCICTTFIFLDRRENTFCVPMHCGSSMLSGLTASYALTWFPNQSPPSGWQIASAGLIVVALLLLSPLHHFELYLGKLRYALARMFPGLLNGLQQKHSGAAVGLEPTVANVGFGRQMAAGADEFKKIGQIILFVCSGNTCRSPMAAAIGNAEIARRLQIPAAAVGEAPVQALSAGVSAREGAPMTIEAKQALRAIGIPANGHRASNLTAEMAQQVEKIFCMTQAHRNAVIEIAPAAAGKTLCLDPDGDVEDPMGSKLGNYVNCARRIHGLVRLRFDEMGLAGSFAKLE
jgi:protein-tyrosine-phosphatase